MLVRFRGLHASHLLCRINCILLEKSYKGLKIVGFILKVDPYDIISSSFWEEHLWDNIPLRITSPGLPWQVATKLAIKEKFIIFQFERLEVGNQGVIRVGSFWQWIWSMPFYKLLVVVSSPCVPWLVEASFQFLTPTYNLLSVFYPLLL